MSNCANHHSNFSWNITLVQRQRHWKYLLAVWRKYKRRLQLSHHNLVRCVQRYFCKCLCDVCLLGEFNVWSLFCIDHFINVFDFVLYLPALQRNRLYNIASYIIELGYAVVPSKWIIKLDCVLTNDAHYISPASGDRHRLDIYTTRKCSICYLGDDYCS